jgi:cardiolipin synthase
LLEAVEERDVHVRVIVESTAFNGFENRIGIEWLATELEAIGKRDNVEFKFYNGKMHDKALLIDGEFLIIGSQNFHYSAWGSPSLTEYNLATDDPEATAKFQSEFDYHWDEGIPVERVSD